MCLCAVCVHMLKTRASVCVCQRAGDLADMITRVIREGLEGLVLKDVKVSWLVDQIYLLFNFSSYA